MKNFIFAFAGLSLVLFSGCNDSSSNPTPCPTPSGLAANQAPLYVGGNYINEITTSVTICTPSTGNCQTIPNVLVDTGSNGLRLFGSAISISLPNVTDGSGHNYGTCVTYADTTSQWGAVKYADVVLGSEKAPSVPIQVITADFGSVPPSCTNLETSPAAAGYNGIIGVGLLTNDCPSCVTTASSTQNPQYYQCTASACAFTCAGGSSCPYTTGSTILSQYQVTNPVSKMPTDNNGELFQISAIPDSGAYCTTGVMTLGVGTSANNTPTSAVKIFPASASLTLKTSYDSPSYNFLDSFIDSGSNAYYFNDASGIPTCSYSGYTFYCPTSTLSETATIAGNTGSNASAVPFIVTNASAALSGSNSSMAFAGYSGVGLGSTTFDWGLNFFFGKSVYIGNSGATINGSTATGPYWAF